MEMLSADSDTMLRVLPVAYRYMNEAMSENGDGDDDDHRGSPSAEEEEYHDHDEQQGVEHRLLERGDGVADVVGGVDDDSELDVAGQGGLETGEHGHYLLGYLHGVGAALLLDDDHGALLAVVVGLLCALLEGVVDACDVAQVDGAAVGGGDGQVEELAGVGELALYAQGVCVGADVEGAAGGVAVLCADDLGHFLDGDVICFEAAGVGVDVYLALGGA